MLIGLSNLQITFNESLITFLKFHPTCHFFIRLGSLHDMDLGPPPPIMKTFKEFLLSLDDSVDETEAVKRYNEYKIDFRRQQMQDFFLAHKDEEWYDFSLSLCRKIRFNAGVVLVNHQTFKVHSRDSLF